MRVHELAKSLGVTTAAVLEAAAAAGIAADHTLDALTSAEQLTLTVALVPAAAVALLGETPSDSETPDSETLPATVEQRYRLVRRAAVGTVACSHVSVGETVGAEAWASMPEWMQAYFDAEDEPAAAAAG